MTFRVLVGMLQLKTEMGAMCRCSLTSRWSFDMPTNAIKNKHDTICDMTIVQRPTYKWDKRKSPQERQTKLTCIFGMLASEFQPDPMQLFKKTRYNLFLSNCPIIEKIFKCISNGTNPWSISTKRNCCPISCCLACFFDLCWLKQTELTTRQWWCCSNRVLSELTRP